MPVPALPIVVIGLAVLTTAVRGGKRRGMTAERKVVFETFLNECKDATALRQMADVFRKEGLIGEATVLEGRARLRELPKELKDQRRDAFRKGLASKNPDAIEKLADAFEAEFCTAAAKKLRERAQGLRGQPTIDSSEEYVTEVPPEEKAPEESKEQPKEEAKAPEVPEAKKDAAAS